MRRWAALVLLLSLVRIASGDPRPEAPAPEPQTIKEVADAAIAAIGKKDAAALKALAELETPDAWQVADFLCANGEAASAEAFAKASAHPAVKGLAEYVASRKGKGAETEARSALLDAQAALEEGQLETAFSKIDGVTSQGDSVLASLLAGARGAILQGLGRHEDASKAYTGAADIAARIGWKAQAGAAYFEAGMGAYRRSDYRGALALWLQAVPFLEAGSDRIAFAGTVQNVAVLQKTLGDWKQALAFHERALKIREELADKPGIAQSYSNLGSMYADFGDLEKALDLHTKALRIREELADPSLIGGSLASIASIHHSRGDSAKAIDFFTRALALQRGGDDASATANTLAAMGLTRASLGETKKALALEDEARALLGADEEAHRDLVAQIQANVGYIHYARGDCGRAIDVLTKALDAAEAIGDARLEAVCLATLGATNLKVGDYPRAMGLLMRALKAADRLGDRPTQCAILGQIGEIHRLRGDHVKALEMQERAQRLAEDSGDRAGLASVTSNISAIYLSLGDVRKSLELLERARGLYEKLGRRANLANCLSNIGIAKSRQEDFAGAIDLYAKALAIHEELGDRLGIASALTNIADANVRTGEPKKAIPLLERSQRIREEMKDRVGLAGVLGGLGDAHRGLKDPKKALGFYERATLEAERLGSPEMLVDALTGAAEAHFDLGDAALSIEKAKRAASYVDRMTHGQGEEQGAAAQAQFARLYDAGTRASVALGDVDQAAFFLETGRAGTLLESLGGRDMLRSWSLPPELVEAETRARADESTALRAYTDALDAGELGPIRAMKTALDGTRSTLQEVLERITREYKSAIVVPSKAATLGGMQGFLEPADALVLYWLLPDEAVALVITPDTARLVKLGKTPELKVACEALSLSDPTTDSTKALNVLRSLVATKLELPAATKRVLVSSDGALSYVPFSLLFEGKLVAYVPSGTAYGQLREDRRRKGSGVLALGDPDYRGADTKAVALVRGGPKLVALPGTRIEAKAIGDVVLLGPDANASALKSAVAKRPRWHSIHLGCHGLVDPEQPMRCSLALTPEGGGSGLLMAQDVGLLKMPTDLAVLSACETMKGRIYRGEGIVGITRMFMYAGAPRLITSLWKVDDEATRALMIKFYELWNPKDGSKPIGTAEALVAAQAYVRGQEKWKHPYYWAAWVLWGLPD